MSKQPYEASGQGSVGTAGLAGRTLTAMGQNPGTLVNLKITGKWTVTPTYGTVAAFHSSPYHFQEDPPVNQHRCGKPTMKVDNFAGESPTISCMFAPENPTIYRTQIPISKGLHLSQRTHISSDPPSQAQVVQVPRVRWNIL